MIGRLVRFLALVLGLVLGLGLALTVQGRMEHLRALSPWLGPLPGWTGAVAADAGVLAGQAHGPAGAVLHWRLAGIDSGGPHWALRAEGAGLALALTARLARPGDLGPALALTDARGEAVLTGGQVAGHFVVTGGGGRLDGAGLALELTGQGRRLLREGEAVPDGPARLGLMAGAGWWLDLGGQVVTGAEMAALLSE